MFYAAIAPSIGRVTVHGLPTMADALRAGEALQDHYVAAHGGNYPVATIGQESIAGSPLGEHTLPRR